ncbi:MAG: YeeE/YedE family protein [Flavobacteriaceae bacterium]|nr:MAG: YeeE/YedE family protein [Flavobacteriaceae bacterium]
MEQILSFLSKPWPFYVSGLAISFVMLLLLWMGKNFGVSDTLRTGCAMLGAGKTASFFDFDWKEQRWNLAFVFGAMIGGYIAQTFLHAPTNISQETISDLQKLGIEYNGGLAPDSLFSWESLATTKGFVTLILGGFLVGFGSRWAGGCTSGHAISGLSNLQIPSLIAVVGFFIGGLVMTHLIFPFIFK